MQIQASWEFGFLHFYPEIFQIISSFSTLESKVSYSGIKYILLLAQSRDPIVFQWGELEGNEQAYFNGENRGPPTQATGPPRSDAGVGIGMLRGAYVLY